MESDATILPVAATVQAGELAIPGPPVDECWKQIGVQGDRSCLKLAQHAHCRSCPTYTRAGALMLNRPLPANYRREWAAYYAGDRKRVAPANVSVTVFRLGPEWLAFDTRLLQEVTEQRPMHSVPHRRMGVVLGLVNVRGELLLCVSLARLLAVEQDLPRERLRKEYRRLVVVETDARRIAFPVDAVEGVHRFSRDEVQPAPATVAHAQRSFTRGVIRWRDHTIGWLDPAAVSFHLNRSLL